MPAYMGPNYHLAPSLVALFNEVNARWPKRDKASDGWIGDTAHAARASDHNPDWSAGGVVRAIDLDKDGINVDELLGAVVRDRRVWYVIWNRRIASATDDGSPWDWETYNGANPHDKHIHISIKHTRSAETDTGRWLKSVPDAKEADDVPFTEAQLRAMMQAEIEEYMARFWTAPTGTGTAIRAQLDRIEKQTKPEVQ